MGHAARHAPPGGNHVATSGLNPACILLFHGLLGEGERGDRYALPERRFARWLRQFRDENRACASLPRWWAEETPAAGPQLVLAFDDGGESDFQRAFPRLLEAGQPAVFFINTARVGAPGYLSWNQIREMRRAGMSIQSHGHDHVALTQLETSELDAQLQHSRRCLEDRLGDVVEFLSVPYGFWNRRVHISALRAGYRALCTSQTGLAQPGHTLLPRNAVRRGTSDLGLQALLRGSRGYFAWRRLRAGALAAPKQLLLRCAPRASQVTG